MEDSGGQVVETIWQPQPFVMMILSYYYRRRSPTCFDTNSNNYQLWTLIRYYFSTCCNKQSTKLLRVIFRGFIDFKLFLFGFCTIINDEVQASHWFKFILLYLSLIFCSVFSVATDIAQRITLKKQRRFITIGLFSIFYVGTAKNSSIAYFCYREWYFSHLWSTQNWTFSNSNSVIANKCEHSTICIQIILLLSLLPLTTGTHRRDFVSDGRTTQTQVDLYGYILRIHPKSPTTSTLSFKTFKKSPAAAAHLLWNVKN
jgi:hypothetical protein